MSAASVQRVSADPHAPSAVALEWEADAGGDAVWRIERRPVGGEWRLAGELPARCRRFESVGLRPGTRWSHRLRRESAGEESEWHAAPDALTPRMPESLRGEVLLGPTPGFPRNTEGQTILVGDGRLVHVFGQWPGRSDHARGVRIGAIESTDRGESWSRPRCWFREEGFDLYHPGVVGLPNGAMGLSYTKRRSGEARQQSGERVFRWSGDDGETWSAEILISNGGWEHYQTSRCAVMRVLGSGRLVQPFVRRLQRTGAPQGHIATFVGLSDDGGRTWRVVPEEPLREPETDTFHEPTVVEWAPDRLLMLGRTQTGWLWESRSDDGGGTWSPPRRSNLPSSIAPAMLVNVPGRDAIGVVWNPCVEEGNPRTPRSVLAWSLSEDGGRTWRGYRELEHRRPRQDNSACGWAYGVVLWDEGLVHLTYMELRATSENFLTRYQRLSRARLLGDDG